MSPSLLWVKKVFNPSATWVVLMVAAAIPLAAMAGVATKASSNPDTGIVFLVVKFPAAVNQLPPLAQASWPVPHCYF